MNLQSYLAFDGNCQEALDFYSDLFNADIINRHTYGDKKCDTMLPFRHKLEHAELKGTGIHFIAFDAAPDLPIDYGNQIHLSIVIIDSEEAEYVFDELSDGGLVQQTFTGNDRYYYGRCTDRFGINWMVNSPNVKFH